MANALDTCAVCPRLCRHACPVAVGSGREAAVPATIAEVLRGWRDGHQDDSLAREAATMCVDCGRCQDACHLHVPLPKALRDARFKLGLLAQPQDPETIEGAGDLVALQTDDRAWFGPLSRRLGVPVARWRTHDALGAACAGCDRWGEYLRILDTIVDGRHVVTAHGGAYRVLREAGIGVSWLHDSLDLPDAAPSCATNATHCCGGGEPLASGHPDIAADMAARWPASTFTIDSRCRTHLRAHGRALGDSIDWLLDQP